MLQSKFAEFLQLYSSTTLVYSTFLLVSDLIRCADQLYASMDTKHKTIQKSFEKL